jgi:hypothetical protein
MAGTEVRNALDGQVRAATGKVPTEAMARILRIRQIILGILPRTGSLPAGSPERFVLERTATYYLPTSLESYLSLPRTYATQQPVQNGKTAREILIDQLTLLETQMTEVAEAVNRNDASRLLIHGRFLEDRFGNPPLQPPSGSEGIQNDAGPSKGPGVS